MFSKIKREIFKKTNLFSLTKKLFSFKPTIPKLRNRNYNFYEVLGVEMTCTNEQIRAAYLKLAKQYHPDVNKDPGSDDKFKTLTLAYEALSNQRNRDLYDAYMDNDPYSQEWKYKEEHYREDTNEDSASRFYREKAKYDKNNQNYYKHQSDSNFWKGNKEDFEGEFYRDFENIFNKGSGFTKPKKEQKADDILLEIKISLSDSFHGTEKGIKFTRIEKCRGCLGYRSQPGHRPSKCFSCNGTGEIKTSMFNSKKCNQCKGLGTIVKYPCKECEAKGVKTYEIEEVIPIPRGIRNGTNIRLEKKGHVSESLDTQSGDLLVKIVVENENTNMLRINDDIHYSVDLSLLDAIFGCKKEISTIENTLELVEVKPGQQCDDKIVFNNRGFFIPEGLGTNRGNMIVDFKIKIPSGEKLNPEKQNDLKNILNIIL